MKVAQVFYNSYNSDWTSDDLLEAFFTARDWAKALSQRGTSIDLYFRFHKNHSIKDRSTTYYFIRDKLPAKIKNFHLPIIYLRKVAKHLFQSQPDIVHAHNLEAVLPHLLLRILIGQRIPILIQDHGSLPRTKLHYLQKWIFPQFNAFLFSAQGQEDVWVTKGLIFSREKCFFVLENSSHFTYSSRKIARAITKMQGNPVFLWVGNFDQNKDPLTVIAAFAKAKPHMKDARLYMIYRQNALEHEVLGKITQSPILLNSVELLGAKKREELETYYNSADYIISGSHKEGSGYSVIEAISCGVIPILTDIDSFKFLTNNGEVGVLWKVGNVKDLVNKLLSLKDTDINKERSKALRHFNSHLRFDSLADQCLATYKAILKKKFD